MMTVPTRERSRALWFPAVPDARMRQQPDSPPDAVNPARICRSRPAPHPQE